MSLTSDRIFLPDGQPVKLCTGLAKDVSDGAHTFGELYEHRTALFLLLVAHYLNHSWWSYRDSKGFDCSPYILCGCLLPKSKEEITYHLDSSYIPILETIGVLELATAPMWNCFNVTPPTDRIISEAIRTKKS